MTNLNLPMWHLNQDCLLLTAQPNLPGQQGMGLSVRFMGINHKAIASYLVSLYCSLAVLTEDALGVLENVEVGNYHEYK